MSPTRRAIFINRFYWPDETATAQLLTDLAEGLAGRGRAVTVIASRPRAAGPGREDRRGVRICRVGGTRGAGPGVAAKARDFITFYALALIALWREVRRGDAVIALTDPPLIGVGAAVVAGLRGARLCHWVQDIYPEVAVTLGAPRVLNLLGSCRDGAWRRARICVTLGTDMAAALEGGGVAPSALRLLPNWAPAGLRPPPAAEIARVRASWGVEGKFVVGYSGNLGRVHDVDAIVELADALRGDPSIWFVLVGGGPQRRRIESEARRRGLRQFSFLPPAPRADLAASLAAPDLQLVTLRAGCERSVFPSKLYGAAAVGRPVLFLGLSRSEIARLVAARGLGGAFERTQIAAAAGAVRAWSASGDWRRTAEAAALRFASSSPGSAEAVLAWDTWLYPGAGVDLPPEPNHTAAQSAA